MCGLGVLRAEWALLIEIDKQTTKTTKITDYQEHCTGSGTILPALRGGCMQVWGVPASLRCARLWVLVRTYMRSA